MLKKYLKNTSGNFSIMFAVGATVLLLGAGLAIDTSGAMSQKSKLQSLSDAAVLAAVTSGEENPAKLKKIVRENLEANNLNGLDIDWDLVIEGDTVTVNVGAPYDTRLFGLAGKDQIPVNSLSAAKFPEDVPINIALVLDRTGSMAGANMSALKTASSVLIDEFREYESDTQVAVVPFSNYVNVGLANRNENWIEVPADTTVHIPAGQCYMRQPTTCVSSETYTQTYQDDGVSRTRERTQCTERVNNGPEVLYCPPAQTKEIKWNGCIGSRSGDYNQTAAYLGKRIPGIMDADCGEEVLELTSNMDQVKVKINSLTASEETYMPVGLINGWRMLSSDKPFDSLSNKDEKRRRALVLMTDGFNTLSLEDPYVSGKHTGNEQVVANELTRTLCQNIKEDNIDLWSVAYNFDGGDTKAILKECASGADQFFDASNPAELIAAFEDIGNSLFTVRLTQ